MEVSKDYKGVVQLINYIAHTFRHVPISKTKLLVLLWFSDRLYYTHYGIYMNPLHSYYVGFNGPTNAYVEALLEDELSISKECCTYTAANICLLENTFITSLKRIEKRHCQDMAIETISEVIKSYGDCSDEFLIRLSKESPEYANAPLGFFISKPL